MEAGEDPGSLVSVHTGHMSAPTGHTSAHTGYTSAPTACVSAPTGHMDLYYTILLVENTLWGISLEVNGDILPPPSCECHSSPWLLSGLGVESST